MSGNEGYENKEKDGGDAEEKPFSAKDLAAKVREVLE